MLTHADAGIAADKFRRDSVMKTAGLIGLLAVGVSVFALIAPNDWLADTFWTVAGNGTQVRPFRMQ